MGLMGLMGLMGQMELMGLMGLMGPIWREPSFFNYEVTSNYSL